MVGISSARVEAIITFKHPTKPGKVTLPHPRKDLHPKTLKSIYKQAQLPKR